MMSKVDLSCLPVMSLRRCVTDICLLQLWFWAASALGAGLGFMLVLCYISGVLIAVAVQLGKDVWYCVNA